MIVINGVRWNIILVSSSNPQLQMPNNKVALGCCDIFNHLIYINKKLKGNKMKEVLRHEITHAIIYGYDISLTPREEEAVVEIVARYGKKIVRLADRAYKEIREGI